MIPFRNDVCFNIPHGISIRTSMLVCLDEQCNYDGSGLYSLPYDGEIQGYEIGKAKNKHDTEDDIDILFLLIGRRVSFYLVNTIHNRARRGRYGLINFSMR